MGGGRVDEDRRRHKNTKNRNFWPACRLAWPLIILAAKSNKQSTMTSSSGHQQPNIAECEAADLALYLLEHRFSVSAEWGAMWQ